MIGVLHAIHDTFDDAVLHQLRVLNGRDGVLQPPDTPLQGLAGRAVGTVIMGSRVGPQRVGHGCDSLWANGGCAAIESFAVTITRLHESG